MRASKLTRVDVFYTAASACIALILLSLPPELAPDSGTYLNGSIIRAPLYPFLLSVLPVVFGSASLQVIVALQTMSFMLAAAYFAHSLQASGLCSKHWSFVIFLAACALGAMTSNKILTETFSFAFVLLFFGLMIHALGKKTFPFALYPISFLAILIRQQFLWLLVPLNLLALYLAYSARQRLVLPVTLLVSLAMPVVFLLAANTFYGLRSGVYSYTSTSGIYLLENALYIATDSAPDLFKDDPAAYAFTDELLRVEDAHKMRWKHWNSGVTSDGVYRDYYQGEAAALYVDILTVGSRLGIYDSGKSDDPTALNNADIAKFDKFCSHVAIKVLWSNKLAYAKHIFRKAYNSRFAIIFLSIMLVASASMSLSSMLSPRNFLLIATTAGMLANYLMLCIAHVIISRYSLYSEFFFTISALIYVFSLAKTNLSLTKNAAAAERAACDSGSSSKG